MTSDTSATCGAGRRARRSRVGPFVFESYTPGNGNSFIATRNDDYWRGDGPNSVTGEGLDEIGGFLFRQLGIRRVYTKTPGKPPETDKPFTVRAGNTVHDVARLVHKDLAESLRFARIWGSEVFDGQQVGPEHAVADGDIVELHMR